MRALLFAALVGAVLSLSGCGMGGGLICSVFTPHDNCWP
jgi:hypothetical protein